MVDEAEYSDASTLRDLRQVRREIRLGDTEWFDVLYRVYLFALVGGIAVVFASDSIKGIVDEAVTTVELLTKGPSIAGVAAAVAFAVGLRNGADGGPVSIEPADVRHVLLAPISRRRVLLRPIVQRLRSVAFGVAMVLGVLGQLVAREIDGSRAAWAASGALFGCLLAALYVGAAVVSHALGVARWAASLIGGIGTTWQIAVAWGIWHDATDGLARIGPANLAGSVLFWGIRQRGIDVIALAVALTLVVAALALGGRLRLDPLERRGQLVSQLRFAATVQDIRTVVALRRQLRAETVRARPWIQIRRRPSQPAVSTGSTPRRPRRSASVPSARFIWTRGVVSIMRLPLGRLARLVALACIAGASASASITATPLLLIVFVLAVFLVGVESLEPLAQEVDHPDLTDAVPYDRGRLFARLLGAPALLLAVAGLVGAATASLLEPTHAAAAFALAIPLAWAGAIGAVVTTVRDAPDLPIVATTSLFGGNQGGDSPFALPEFAGFNSLITGAMPIILSTTAAVPVFAMRAQPDVSTVWRSLLGVTLCLVALVFWVIRRDRWAVAVREFFAAGRTDLATTGNATGNATESTTGNATGSTDA